MSLLRKLRNNSKCFNHLKANFKTIFESDELQKESIVRIFQTVANPIQLFLKRKQFIFSDLQAIYRHNVHLMGEYMKEYGLGDTIQNPQTGKTVSQCKRGRESLWKGSRQEIHPKGDDPQTSPMF